MHFYYMYYRRQAQSTLGPWAHARQPFVYLWTVSCELGLTEKGQRQVARRMRNASGVRTSHL